MRVLLGWLALSAIAACGQKGPLYLPDEARQVIAKPAADQTKAPPATAPQSGAASPSDESQTTDPNKPKE